MVISTFDERIRNTAQTDKHRDTSRPKSNQGKSRSSQHSSCNSDSDFGYFAGSADFVAVVVADFVACDRLACVGCSPLGLVRPYESPSLR